MIWFFGFMQVIQEILFPSCVHVFVKTNNSKRVEQFRANEEERTKETTSNGKNPSVTSVSSNKTEQVVENRVNSI